MDVLKFKKRQLVSAIAVVTSAMALTGCIDGDSTTSTSSNVVEDAARHEIVQQQAQTSRVLGVVQDTNGNPIEGATVSIGGIMATTDVTGAYELAGVPVTGLATTTTSENGDISIQAGAAGDDLQISVRTPAGFLNATLTVTPKAGQNLVASSHFNGSGGNDTLAADDGLLVVVLGEGLAVGAGITVVPATNATVTGVLRNQDTGEIIADTVVALELVAVAGNDQQQDHADKDVGYSAQPYMATTDAEGRFTMTSVPEDTDFDIVVEGWSNVNIDGSTNGVIGDANDGDFSTTPEVAVQNIGDVTVEAIHSVDGEEPFVVSVAGVVTNATRAILNDDLDGTQGIVIKFSEAITTEVDANSVFVVTNVAAGYPQQVDIAAPVLSADGMTLTVTTVNALPAGTQFNIMLQTTDFEDVAMNTLDEGANANYLGKTLPNFDDLDGNFLELALEIHKDPVVSSGEVIFVDQTGAVTTGPINEDPRGDKEFELLAAINSNFIDNDNASAGTNLSQLNNAEASTEARLLALGDSIVNGAGIGIDPTSVTTDRARVHFTLSDATKYNLSLNDADGISKNLAGDVSFADGTDTGLAIVGAGQPNAIQVEVNAATYAGQTVEVLIDNVDVNDVLTVTSISTLDTALASASITLTDQVSPTTVLQRSYGLTVAGTPQINADYGNGGELSQIANTTFGTPYLYVTPYLLTPQAGAGSLALDRTETWDTLTAAFEADVTNATSGELEMDVDANIPAGAVVYNETAMASWTPGSRNIGVAFSEDVALVGGVTIPTTGFTAALTGFTAQNDVLVNDQGGAAVNNDADLVNIAVDNVITLANSDDGKTLDFTDAVQDETANVAVASDNARVIFKDAMPPIPMSAEYRGDSIVVTYNEAVSLEDTDVFSLYGTGSTSAVNVDADMAEANQDTTTVTLDLLTVDYAGGISVANRQVQSLNKLAIFDRGEYDNDDNAATPDVLASKVVGENVVSVLYAPAVEDAANGVSWSTHSAGVDNPAIVIEDKTGNFALALPISPASLPALDTHVTVTYTFTHRIDLGDLCASAPLAGALTLTAAQVAACFQVSTATIDALDTPADAGTPSGATLSADGKTLVVTANVTAAVTATDTFGPVNNLVSAWDTSASILASSADPAVTDLEIPVTPTP
jgi:hypothetical protein